MRGRRLNRGAAQRVPTRDAQFSSHLLRMRSTLENARRETAESEARHPSLQYPAYNQQGGWFHQVSPTSLPSPSSSSSASTAASAESSPQNIAPGAGATDIMGETTTVASSGTPAQTPMNQGYGIAPSPSPSSSPVTGQQAKQRFFKRKAFYESNAGAADMKAQSDAMTQYSAFSRSQPRTHSVNIRKNEGGVYFSNDDDNRFDAGISSLGLAKKRAKTEGGESLSYRAGQGAAYGTMGAAAAAGSAGLAYAAMKYGPRAFKNAKQYVRGLLSQNHPGDTITPSAPQSSPPEASPVGQQIGEAGPGAAGPAPGQAGSGTASPSAAASGGAQYPGASASAAAHGPSAGDLPGQTAGAGGGGGGGGVPRASIDQPFEAGMQPVVDMEREGKSEEQQEEEKKGIPEDPLALLHRGREEAELKGLAESFQKDPQGSMGTDAEKANMGRGEYTGYSGPYNYPERDDSTLRYLAGYKSLKGNPSSIWESKLRANGQAARRAKYWKWSARKQKWQKMSKTGMGAYMRKGKKGRDIWTGERGQMLYGTSLGDTLAGERLQRKSMEHKEADMAIGTEGAAKVELSKAAKVHM